MEFVIKSRAVPEANPAEPRAARSRTRVLLIDDDPQFTDALKAGLEGTGRFVVQARNSPLMGIDFARRMKPDLIILDLCMPFIDGGEVMATLELDPGMNKVKFIVLSSLVSPTETSSNGVLVSNGHAMMAKPVCLDQLVACIESVLDGET